MFTNTYAMGIDGGNDLSKAFIVINGVPNLMVMSSAITDGSLVKFAEDRKANGENTYSKPQDALERPKCRKRDDGIAEWIGGEIVLSYQHTEEYLGKLALREDTHASTGFGDTSRYWNGRLLRLTLAMSGMLIGDRSYTLHVVTGLPGKTFSEATRDQTIRSLNGYHSFVLNGVEREATITVERVLREGAGAALALGKRGQGLDIQGFVDIGSYSTEFYACDDERKAISRLCDGVDIGVQRVAKYINQQFCAYYGTDTELSAKQMQQLLMAYGNPHAYAYPKVSIRTETVPTTRLSHWTESGVTYVTRLLIEKLAIIWKSGERGGIAESFSDPLYLIGGGAWIFKRELEKHIEKTIHRSSNPELENVIAYTATATQHMQKATIYRAS